MEMRVGLVSVVLVVAGCAVAPEENTGTTAASATVRQSASVCFAGRSFGSDPYASGGNEDLADLCRSLPHLIRDVEGWDAAYPFFRWNADLAHAVDVIAAALDTDGDGAVTSSDADMELNVVGFSWGGFDARDVIARIQDDARFSDERKSVARFFALDPYQTVALAFPRRVMQVPANVATLYEFRHTVAPSDDCSRVIPWLVGPFTGREPECTGDTACNDYDYSAAASTADVDHCGVPAAATHAIRELIAGREPDDLPPASSSGRY
jgi:hypothetical protein